MSLVILKILLSFILATTPMMTQSIDLELNPITDRRLEQSKKPLIISINISGECIISTSKQSVNLDQLSSELAQYSEIEKQRTIYLQANKEVPYSIVVKALSEIRSAGFENCGIISSLEDKNNEAKPLTE